MVKKYCKVIQKMLLAGVFLGTSMPLMATQHEIKVLQQGNPVGGGYYSPAQFVRVERPKPGTYAQGVIKVKLRRHIALEGIVQALPGSSIAKTLQSIGTNSIEAAFPAFNNGVWFSNDEFGLGRIYEIRFDPAFDPWDICQQLEQNPDVEYATPAYFRQWHWKPNDTQFGQQYEHTIIRSEAAWDITKGSPTVVLAISDSGVDWQHEDLATNIWRNTKEIADNGIDDDGNGYIDDVRGWDFVGNVTAQEASQGIFRPDNNPRVEPPPSVNDQSGRTHGTHVAGCAAAVTNNGKGVAGIGNQCSILPLKFGSDNAQASLTAPMIPQGYKSIAYAGLMKATAVNCSWGSTGNFDPTEQDAINFATSQGTLVIAASGNSDLNNDQVAHYPTNYRHVFSVGATGQSDAPTSFTNYGMRVDVFAPGENILSSMPGNQYRASSGTSMASPIVTGIVGLVKTLHPDWSPYQLAHQVRATSENVLASKRNAPRPLYYGRANALRAVAINRSFTTGDRLPGISLSENIPYTINAPGGVVVDGSEITLRLNVKNFLAQAQNIQVGLTSLGGVFSFDNANNTVAQLGTLDSQTVEVRLRVSPDNPWIETIAEVLITYRVGSTYENYEVIEIPVRSTTTNRVTQLRAFSPGSQAQAIAYSTSDWKEISSPTQDVVWAGGTAYEFGIVPRGVMLRATPQGVTRFTYGGTNFDLPITAVYGISTDRAVLAAASEEGGDAKVLVTSDAGATWFSTPVQTLTSKVEALQMFNNTNGIFIGAPLANGNSFVVARTTNGGSNWSAAQLPARRTGELFSGQSHYWNGQNGWIGTTEGRVFYTTNGGQSWQVVSVASGLEISSIAFSSAQEGILTYKTANGSHRIAASTNGGRAWTTLNGTPFDASGFIPVRAYSPFSKNIVLVGEDGSLMFTNDLGTTLRRTKTVKFNQPPVTADSKINPSAETGRLWKMAGTSAVYLDYTLEVPTAAPVLTLSTETLQFANTAVGDTARLQVTVTNTGSRAVNIVSTDIFGNDFRLEGNTPSTIAAGANITLRVAFIPRTSGDKQGTLSLLSDAQNNDVGIVLRGTGVVAQPSTLSSSVENLSFGEVPVRLSKSLDLNLRANGTQNITINAMRIEDDVNNAFSIEQSLQGQTITGNQQRTAKIAFAPLEIRAMEAVLVIEHTGAGSPLRIPLSGAPVVNSVAGGSQIISSLLVSPNPASEKITVTVPKTLANTARIAIYGINGENVVEQNSYLLSDTDTKIEMQVKMLPAGTYVLRIVTERGEIFEAKFIKN